MRVAEPPSVLPAEDQSLWARLQAWRVALVSSRRCAHARQKNGQVIDACSRPRYGGKYLLSARLFWPSGRHLVMSAPRWLKSILAYQGIPYEEHHHDPVFSAARL